MSGIWPKGGGRMGELMRAHDWSRSPLGPPKTWPVSLRSVIGLLLECKFPMFVAWGPELRFLYNDAYADMLGAKHPAALGARFEDVWAEAWPFTRRMVDAAKRREASWREDLPLVVDRYGFDERIWLTFSYSPVEDDSGEVAGVFCAVIETTGQVRDQRARARLLDLDDRLRDLDDPDAILTASAEMLAEQMAADNVHWAIVNSADDWFEIRHEFARPGAARLAGVYLLSGFSEALVGEMRVGGTAVINDIEESPFAARFGEERPGLRGALIAAVVRGGIWRASLSVRTREPRRWAQDELALIRDVAERVWTRAERARAEARVRQSEQRFRAMVNATSNVLFAVNADWTELRSLDGRGLPDHAAAPSRDWLEAHLPPEEQPRVLAVVHDAMASKCVIELEHRIRQPDGSIGWGVTRAIPVLDASGEVTEWFGSVSDISVRKAAEQHLRLMVNELNHRVKNSLATVQAIAAQTLRRGEVAEQVREALAARLVALAEAHDVLTDEKWAGADLLELAAQAAAPYVSLRGISPIHIDGPSVFLPPKTAIAMALAFHELATNAAKYGALSVPGGKVLLSWTVAAAQGGRTLRLGWLERGGPPVRPPQRSGFGTRLIQRGLASELQGAVSLDYQPAGLVCSMEALLPDEPSEGWKLDLQLS